MKISQSDFKINALGFWSITVAYPDATCSVIVVNKASLLHSKLVSYHRDEEHLITIKYHPQGTTNQSTWEGISGANTVEWLHPQKTNKCCFYSITFVNSDITLVSLEFNELLIWTAVGQEYVRTHYPGTERFEDWKGARNVDCISWT